MNKLKVAILEDNKELLKYLKENLEKTTLVDVIVYATNSEDFLEKVKLKVPEALILDIDLASDSMNGLDVADHLKLPVLFVSGKTGDFYRNIEELNLNTRLTVEHISKPITLEKLNKILPKFINEIKSLDKKEFIYLDFQNSKRNKIAVDSIVYLISDKSFGADSNNKRIFFTDRDPEILVDFSFSKMEEKGFQETIFITIHKSYRVNANKILKYLTDTHELELVVYKSLSKSEFIKLPVSDNYRKDVKSLKK